MSLICKTRKIRDRRMLDRCEHEPHAFRRDFASYVTRARIKSKLGNLKVKIGGTRIHILSSKNSFQLIVEKYCMNCTQFVIIVVVSFKAQTEATMMISLNMSGSNFRHINPKLRGISVCPSPNTP